ncbi:MAG: ABC transporter ATP-binding protein [Deltaproteobacteria bacterium]|nr:MAG: ABC transporter ATP-binding protein [Deltaproteobacteria bacterium]
MSHAAVRPESNNISEDFFESFCAIKLDAVGKCYYFYSNPWQRLKELLFKKTTKLGQEFWALRNVTLEIPKGSRLGVIGENGSGKTTLLMLLAGITSPTEGKILINGKVSALLELGLGFNTELSGRDNVFLYGSILGLSREELDARFQEIIAFSELRDFIDRPLKTYSSGMYVRLAFAVAVTVNPDILLIDEALAVGDVRFQQKCLRKLDQFSSEGKTIIVVSHDLNLISNFCDEVLWLKDGCVEDFGRPSKVIKRYEKYLYYKDQLDSQQSIPERDFGDKRAYIRKVELEINGEKKNIVKCGDTLKISIEVEANSDIEQPIIGLSIKDRNALTVLSTNTYYEEMKLQPIKKGQKVVCSFSFRWPNIIPGFYTLSTAIADGIQEKHDMCHWVDDVHILKAISNNKPLGYIGLEDVSIELKYS